MSFYFSTGTASVERILRIAYGNITIGTAFTDSLGTSDIRKSIEDAERYILGMLEDTISSIPNPAPNSLIFSSDYLSSYFAYTQIFAANKPDQESPVVESWRVMAEKAIIAYKGGYQISANVAAFTSQSKIFTSRGVSGIGDGVLEDSGDVRSNYKN